jgi:peptide/nickel transport system substrate-binding protein
MARSAVIVAAVAALAACSAGTTTSAPAVSDNVTEVVETPTPGGSMVIGIPAETNGWNPALAQWADAGSLVGSSVLESLMNVDKDGKFVPYLAQTVTPSADFTSWTIAVRPGITFHDGSALDGQVVKDNLDLYRNDKALSSLALKPLIDSVDVTDPMTVVVHMKQPWATYPSSLSGGSGWIMAESQLNAADGGASKPVGTGPFAFESWTQDSSFKAKKFDHYWQKDKDGQQLPYLDSIEFRVITDNGARSQSLDAGNLDMVLTVGGADIDRLADRYTVVKDYTSEQTFVQLNTGDKPFDNIHAREAVAYAIDRDTIAASQGANLNMSNSLFPASTRWGQTPVPEAYPYDPAKAKDQLEQYKKETGATSLSFELTSLPEISNQTISQLLEQQWKAVGIDVTLNTAEQTTFITALAFGNTTATLMRNYGYLDPDSDYYFFHKSTAKGKGQLNINFTQFKDDQLSKDFDDGRQTADPAARQKVYDDAVKIINAAAINLWLYNTPYAIIAKPDVRGLNPARETGFGTFLPKPWVGSLWFKK